MNSEAQVEALREAAARFAAAGGAWVQDAWVEPHQADVRVTAATAEPGLPLRAHLAFVLEPDGRRERILRFTADRDKVESFAPGDQVFPLRVSPRAAAEAGPVARRPGPGRWRQWWRGWSSLVCSWPGSWQAAARGQTTFGAWPKQL